MSESITTTREEKYSVRQLIGIGVVTRLLMSTLTKMFWPFLPLIASGMGVSTIVIGWLLSSRSVVGLVSPWFGALADRRGYRDVMQIGLFLCAIGYFIVGSSTNVWMAGIGMMIGGLGDFIFGPTLQAYLSARLPYAQRARGLGVLEYSWALASIIGLFFVGQLIEISSWRAPFLLISSVLFVIAFWYKNLPEADQPVQTTPPQGVRKGPPPPVPALSAAEELEEGLGVGANLVKFLDLGPNWRSTWATMFASGFVLFGAIHLFTSYGTWLSQEYALGAAQLGQVAFILGCGDLCGSVLVSVLNDRFGKRRAFLWGSLIAAICFLSLSFFNSGLIAAVIGLILVRFAFEFTIVSSIPLLSEQVPEQRGKVLTLRSISSLLAGVIAGISSPWAYATYGVIGLSAISSISVLVGFAMIVAWVREPEM